MSAGNRDLGCRTVGGDAVGERLAGQLAAEFELGTPGQRGPRRRPEHRGA